MYPIDGAVHHVGRDSLGVPGRDLVYGHRGYKSRPGPGKSDYGVGQGILGSRPSLHHGRRLHKFHDGRRNRPDESNLPRQLRSTNGSEEEVRSQQLFPREPEHQTAVVRSSYLSAARLSREQGPLPIPAAPSDAEAARSQALRYRGASTFPTRQRDTLRNHRPPVI
jgi:hypothetical protein